MDDAKQMPLVVVVDDEEQIVSSLRRILMRQKFKVEGFTDPRLALAFLENERPHVVISDMRMPIMSGQDFLSKVNVLRPECYRVVLTGYADMNDTLDVVNRGAISGYLQKPWESGHLISVVEKGAAHTELFFENERLRAALEEANANLEDKVERRTKQIRAALTKLERTHEANLNVLFNLLSSHPNINGEFAKNVSRIARRIAGKLNDNNDFLENVRLSGLLCELGFIGLPFQLCSIPFTKMTAGQITEFKKQSEIASQILSPASHWNDVARILREQYTAFKPLTAKATPPSLGAQIIAVVRDYFRMREGRYFDKPVSHPRAMAELMKYRESRYSDNVIDLISKSPQLLDVGHLPGNYNLDDIAPGMVLSDDVYTMNNILLLPSGHTFTQQTISRLRYFQSSLPHDFKLPISDPEEN